LTKSQHEGKNPITDKGGVRKGWQKNLEKMGKKPDAKTKQGEKRKQKKKKKKNSPGGSKTRKKALKDHQKVTRNIKNLGDAHD